MLAAEVFSWIAEVTLLPQGQRECYNAGRAFYQRYLNSSTCRPADAALPNTCLSPPHDKTSPDNLYGPINSPNGAATWNNYNVLVTSSALDRSLMSARSFTAVSSLARAHITIPSPS